MVKNKDGFKIQIFDKDMDSLYTGTVWPNDQYEYEHDEGGEFQVCISLTDSMFNVGSKKYHQIKTKVVFASDFHRDRRENKGEPAFHQKHEEEQAIKKYGLTQGHFKPIQDRLSKISERLG